ncbi:hypothetical protein FK220_004515 [Flavobacteriaceae bacterium TP-CH-4]|uniref:Inosine/uridine-preferring nucleoside hydrolase domain-containing protein n=1 Tax=Pelagihabitans pacificus TaxID=2696054 RepID=A0A967ATA9_9FLAO|nr:nucleoside hydrolase [Pelagihabitans pacificus]NHF58588.1 hypothetical protein [Pelagihabitans pacificus]
MRILYLLLLSATPVLGQSQPENIPKIIFDTDIGGDIDDLGALYALHVYADQGQCTIEAIMSSWSMQHHVTGIDAVNTYFGRPDIPIGAHEGEVFAKEEYTWYLGENYQSDQTHATSMKATELYRQLLSQAEDHSTTIVVTGRMNNLYKLFKSQPDRFSSLDGVELVSKKVDRFFIMGGIYTEGLEKEANFKHGGPGVSKYVIEHCPRPIIFNGGEIGGSQFGYSTGTRINEWPDGHILKAGYGYFFRNPPKWTGLASSDTIAPWSIWDIITVQMAVTGAKDYFDVVSEGYNQLEEDGTNRWQSQPDKQHSYLVAKMDPKIYADTIIEPLLMTEARSQQ